MSMSECRDSWSSIWSKKPTPVEIFDLPVPSRLTETETEVSLVLRETAPVRLAAVSAIWLLHRGMTRVPYQAFPKISRSGAAEKRHHLQSAEAHLHRSQQGR